jgi:uncharacterized membrane protein
LSSKFCKKFKKENVAIIAGCIGIGMILVIILPFWVWVTIVSIALIAFAVSYWCD